MGKDKIHKKKHKKDKKKKSKKVPDRKRHYSSSSESSSSEEEWVEKAPITKNDPPKERDEWMSMESIFSGKTRKELNESKPKPEKEFNLLDKPGQSARELNPYWKNGGTGLPPEERKPSKASLHSNLQKNRYSRSSSDSDDAYQKPRNTYVVSSESESSDHRESKKDDISSRRGDSRVSRDSSYSYENKRKLNFKRPDDSFESDYKRGGTDKNSDNPRYKKPNFRIPAEESSFKRTYYSNESSSGRKPWKKLTSEDMTESKAASERSAKEKSPDYEEKPKEQSSPKAEPDNKVLSLKEMNELSASILKAELMGNKLLAEELKAKLKEARWKKEASSFPDVVDEKGRKVVILTETDSKGFTRPAKDVSNEGHYSKKKKKAETHEGKKRVRYFADDDQHSLKDLFEKEKYSSAYDQNATFVKLSSKQKNDIMDDEAVFDAARMDDNDKEEKKKWNNAVKRQSALEKVLDDCRFCLGTKNVSIDSIVHMKEKVYLAVPTFQSLTERHCLIIPQCHVPCGTMLDEDIWNEIMVLRKMLVRAFAKEDEDIIFFESAMHLQRRPHMILHCVPVPKEVGDTAPIYFKKAIMECENEWSNNKKLVELAGRDVRKAVPKGLPYFAVDFGLQSGYAHVIEDAKLFPNNFAQEIIGGMLDLDHTIWRKLKKDTTENIKTKVESMKELLGSEDTT